MRCRVAMNEPLKTEQTTCGHKTYISPEEIKVLPLYRYTGSIELIQRQEAIGPAVEKLEREQVLGFDTETQPSFEKGRSFPTALVQFATSRNVYIFQLANFRRWDGLAKILSSPAILKVGVAVDHDIAKLRELFPFEPAGFVDLAHLAAQAGIKNRGIRGLAALLMGIRVSKGARRSNWGRRQLSSHQLAYAAADAWLCRELYFRLQSLAAARRTS